jgi:hypothetical protein
MLRKTCVVLALVVFGLASVAQAQLTSVSIVQDGSPYQEFKGFGGSFDVPYMSSKPVLDGNMADGEWANTLYTEWGPSDLAAWGDIHGYIQNEPGAVRADGFMSQLLASPIEDASTALTDLDSYSQLWIGWDENFLYEAMLVTDSVYDVIGTQDGGFWERDGFFIQLDFGQDEENFLLLAFSAMPMDAARYAIYSGFFGREEFHFYGDDPAFFMGTASGFSLTQDGWLLETRAAFAHMNRYQPIAIGTGTQFRNCYHTLDPDGEDGFGGQFQGFSGKTQADKTEWAVWTMVGGNAPTAVEQTTWGALKKSYQ